MGRAIGRLAGKGGKTRFLLENTTKTRIVIADSRIHILGSYDDIAQARKAICALILGSYFILSFKFYQYEAAYYLFVIRLLDFMVVI